MTARLPSTGAILTDVAEGKTAVGLPEKTNANATRPRGMAPVPAGSFIMGSDAFYAEERPARRETVGGFFIDISPVTNDQFAAFIAQTAYVTMAEKAGGSFVFRPTAGPVDLRQAPVWWEWTPGASWRHPLGLSGSPDGRGRHPVVHVTQQDALAYAAWCGKRLPLETEWERAARGGLENAVYAWGDTFRPEGRYMANTWQGEFPFNNLAEDGYEGTSPVGSFPPNGYGLYDMIGNVWEWTATTCHEATKAVCGCAGGKTAEEEIVLKGGSFLCAPDYCRRYRPSARIMQPPTFSSNHTGFRCVRDLSM